MLIIFIRTVIIYTVLIFSMRLMGKRQIGQLDITDLATTLLLSEIATLPIEDPDIPIINAIIPIITLLTFEIVSSALLSKTPKLKNLFSSRPGFLINNGKIDQKELSRNRISSDELISELRQRGVCDISEVAYAIIEPDGKITVLPKSKNRPICASDININIEEDSLSHIIISGGVINDYGLKITGKDREWLYSELKKKKCRSREVFLMTLNDTGKINIIMKEKE